MRKCRRNALNGGNNRGGLELTDIAVCIILRSVDEGTEMVRRRGETRSPPRGIRRGGCPQSPWRRGRPRGRERETQTRRGPDEDWLVGKKARMLFQIADAQPCRAGKRTSALTVTRAAKSEASSLRYTPLRERTRRASESYVGESCACPRERASWVIRGDE